MEIYQEKESFKDSLETFVNVMSKRMVSIKDNQLCIARQVVESNISKKS